MGYNPTYRGDNPTNRGYNPTNMGYNPTNNRGYSPTYNGKFRGPLCTKRPPFKKSKNFFLSKSLPPGQRWHQWVIFRDPQGHGTQLTWHQAGPTWRIIPVSI